MIKKTNRIIIMGMIFSILSSSAIVFANPSNEENVTTQNKNIENNIDKENSKSVESKEENNDWVWQKGEDGLWHRTTPAKENNTQEHIRHNDDTAKDFLKKEREVLKDFKNLIGTLTKKIDDFNNYVKHI